MSPVANLQAAAALLERAYRLALVLQNVQPCDSENAGFVAAELVEVLDEARVALLKA
ncbi:MULTISPECIES: hypothetical protein [Acidovorax]|uniref:hypothetical protein n=1 Tax=Acidovorax TaxID=12916 RepID=UPI000237582D|nr:MULTISPECIES: hypothetical protein [Acidovorax]